MGQTSSVHRLTAAACAISFASSTPEASTAGGEDRPAAAPAGNFAPTGAMSGRLACPPGWTLEGLHGVPGCRTELSFRGGELELSARVYIPLSGSPRDPPPGGFPAVVVVPGSGPSERGHPWTELVASAFLEIGLAVMLPDKRGSEGSEGDWRRATYHDLAEDAAAAVAELRERAEVNGGRIGIAGLSEGGQVVAIVGARDVDLAFVVNVVGGAVPFVPKVMYEMRHALRDEGLEGERLERAERLLETAAAYTTRAIDWPTYEADFADARRSLGAIVDRYFMADSSHWRWDFLRAHRDWDPVGYWKEVRVPVLVLYGREDHNQPSAESAKRLREAFAEAGHEDASVIVFPGLGHSLRGNSGLDERVLETLAEWLNAHL
jgi:pimeloyl-ACP methyl ester carboxylesterase